MVEATRIAHIPTQMIIVSGLSSMSVPTEISFSHQPYRILPDYDDYFIWNDDKKDDPYSDDNCEYG